MSEVVDDITIQDEHGLLRRVPYWPNMYKFDHNLGVHRPTSACFGDRETNDIEVSVSTEYELLQSGGSYVDLITEGSKGFGIARFIAEVPRKQVDPTQKITRNPTDTDVYHALVVGDKPKRVKKALVKSSIIVEPITPE